LTEADNSRIVYFDWVRIGAAFLIMLLHTASLCWYDTDVSSAPWLFLNIFKTLTDHAVLLFVMISGSLFLGRVIPAKQLYLKYILRIFCAFVFWSFLYALISNYMWGIGSVLTVTLASHYHLWFLPMIAGLYIASPILRLFVKNDSLFRYFLILSFTFTFMIPQILGLISDFGGSGVLQWINAVNDRLNELGVHLVFGYSFYFLMGYHLHRTDFRRKHRLILYALGAAGLIATFALSYAQAQLNGEPLDNYHTNFNIGVLLAAMALFVFFKYNFKNDSAFVRALSKYSFGAYLIHALVIEQLSERLGLNALSFHPLLAVPAVAVITFEVSFAVSALLNRIPFVKKYLV